MSSRRIALAASLAALYLASPATAKEISQVKACGADGCKTVKSVGPEGHELLPAGGGTTPKLAPYYKLAIGLGDGSGRVFDTFDVLWAPSIGMIASEETPSPYWRTASPAARRVAEQVTKGLTPFPAADMPVALPAPKVEETVTTETAATTGGGDGGGSPWVLLAVGCVVAAGGAFALRRRSLRID